MTTSFSDQRLQTVSCDVEKKAIPSEIGRGEPHYCVFVSQTRVLCVRSDILSLDSIWMLKLCPLDCQSSVSENSNVPCWRVNLLCPQTSTNSPITTQSVMSQITRLVRRTQISKIQSKRCQQKRRWMNRRASSGLVLDIDPSRGRSPHAG